MAKKQKELLDITDVDLAIEAKFGLSQIVLKDDLRWRMKLIVWEILPRSYRNYNIKMEVDEEPFENRIRSVEQKIERINNEASLFPKEDLKNIRDLKDLIKEIKKELSELKDKCEVIEFIAEIEEIKYKNSNTIVIMKFPDVVIDPLNKSKGLINHYKVIFSPLF